MTDDQLPGLRSFGVAMGGAHVGEGGTPETLQHHLAHLTAADVVQAAAKITLFLESVGTGSLADSQSELVDLVFPGEIGVGIQAGLDAGSDDGGFDVVFAPGQLMVLQKLALAICPVGPATSFDGGASVGHFVTAAAQVNDVREAMGAADAGGMDLTDLAMYCFRSGELNRLRHPRPVAGRAQRMWIDSPVSWPAGVEHPEDFSQRTFGVSFDEFTAIAATPALARLDHRTYALNEVPFNPEHYFATTRVDPAAMRSVLDQLTFRPAESSSIVNDAATYWSLMDFAERPLLPAGPGLVVPSSLRFGLERPTTGVFWMLHAAHSGSVGPLTEHFGKVFERYCADAAVGLAGDAVTVTGDFDYGPAADRRRTPDVMITTGPPQPVRVFIECRAGRPNSRVFRNGSRTDFEDYIRRDLVEKLHQLDHRISDHMHGRFQLADDLAGPDDPYYPVLVVDEPFHWTAALRNIVDDRVRDLRLFRDPRVAKPIICGVDDYDSLIGAAERTGDLPGLLRRYLLSDRADPIDRHLYEAAGPLRPSAFCSNGWERFHTRLREALFA